MNKKALFIGDRCIAHQVLIDELESRDYRVDIITREQLGLAQLDSENPVWRSEEEQVLQQLSDYNLYLVPQSVNDSKHEYSGFKAAAKIKEIHPEAKAIVYAWTNKRGVLDPSYEFLEQARRENALKAQQDAANASLKAMGYVMNPFTGKMEKTLEKQRLELSAAQAAEPTTFSSGGNLFQYDPTTGQTSMIYQQPEEEADVWPTGTPTSYKEWQLAGSPGTYESWVADEEDKESDYKKDLLADKGSGMPYDKAVEIYSPFVSRAWIDWTYGGEKPGEVPTGYMISGGKLIKIPTEEDIKKQQEKASKNVFTRGWSEVVEWFAGE